MDLRLKANAKTIEAFKPAQKDVMAATKTEKLSFVEDASLEASVFAVDHIEYGPDAKTGQM